MADKIQERINEIVQGDENTLLQALSDAPIYQLNALIIILERGSASPQLVNEITKITGVGTRILGRSIGEIATATLDVLGVEKYTGSNRLIIEMVGHYKGKLQHEQV